MFFKNAQFFRVTLQPGVTPESVFESLAQRTFQPVGPVDRSSRGWIPPVATDAASLTRHVQGRHALALQVEEKILPGSVVAREVDRIADEITQNEGRRPGRKRLAEIKLTVIETLLPKAFTRLKRIDGWVDLRSGWLCVDASSVGKGEDFASFLGECAPGLAIRLVHTVTSPEFGMARCLLDDAEVPVDCTVDQDCELRREQDGGNPTVRFSHHALDGEDVRVHLAAGKQPVKLAMTWNDRVSFVLTDDLLLKRIDFLDLLRSEVSEDDRESPETFFDAQLLISSSNLIELFEGLLAWLGGERQPEPDRDAEAE